MTETAALIIKVDSSGAARATQHLRDLERAAGSTERSAHKLGKAWGTAIGLIGSAAVAGAVTNYIKLADTYALMTARLGMVTKGAEGLKQAQGDLFKLAQESRTSLEGVTDLYVKLANSSDELRNNQSLLIGVTTNVSKALTLSGADAASATAVIRQFSQAMASGALRGDEFVSVMEGAPRLARAIADGLNVPIGALRKMAAEGKLTADTVIRALESQGQVIDREFRNMPLTVGGAVQQVRNSLMQLVGDTDTATGASKDLAGAISGLATTLASEQTKAGFATVVGGLASVVSYSAQAIQWLAKFSAQLDQSLGNGQRKGNAKDWAAGLWEWGNAVGNKDWERAGHAMRRSAAGVNGAPVADFSGSSGSSRAGSAADELVANWRWYDGSKPTATAPRPPGIPKIGGGGGGGGRRAQAAATREVTTAEKAYLELMKEVAAHDEYVDDVQREYTNEKLRRADQEREAVERGRAATDDLIRDMEFEISLIGKSNIEREKAILLRDLEGKATATQAARVSELVDKMQGEAAKQEGKRAVAGLFADMVTDIDKASDRFDEFVENMRRRLIELAMQKLLDKIFPAAGNESGQTATGGSGFWSAVLGALFGGGRAMGGAVSGSKLYEVGEGGKPELFSQQGRTYLIPGNDGVVTPARSAAASAAMTPRVNVNIHNAPAGAEVRSRPNPLGGLDIDVIFRQFEGRMAGNVAAGASPLGAALKGRYGLRDAV